MKIKIIETSWSGRPGYVPKEILHEYEAILNKEYVVKTRDVDYIKENKIIKSTEIVLSFVITSINEDGVTIHTNDSFSLEGAGMFLKGEQKDFKVLKGDSLKLTTLTLDYGYIFIFSLE